MKSDFMLAINQLCAERKLSSEVVMEAVEAALISAYKRNFGSASNIEVRIEPSTGDVRVFAIKDVVETVQDRKVEIQLEEARQLNPNTVIGETLMIESTPRDFGRIAAQTAKQVILQRIREAERDAQYANFADSAGEIALGTIQSVDYHSGDVIVNLDGAEALLPSREQVPGERYRRGMRLRAYVMDVRRGNRGPQITLSRRSSALLRRLLELEVPEIFNGLVEIKGIAREAGSRSKVAVYATQDGVDPVGSCVGVRGGRIQNVVNELGGEKIDVVQWDSGLAIFIANALSPAKVMNVILDDDPESGKTASVIVPDRQLSLAIGKEGQNARLAAKLTGWRIDIKSATEAAEETLGRFEDVEVAPDDMDLLSLAEVILRKRDKEDREDWSESERSMIKAQVEESEEGLDWPEEEPGLQMQPEAKAQVEVDEAASALDSVVEVEESEVTEEAAEPALEMAGDVVQAEPESLVAETETQVREKELFDESELEPTFEGEPIEDSLGWVVTEPEEDYYSGWGEVEEPSEEEEVEWVLEDFGEPESSEASKRKRKKGRKRRGKRVFDDDTGTEDWRW